MKAWEREIRDVAEELPELFRNRPVRVVKTGREIVRELTKAELKEFRKGLRESEGTSEIHYDRAYTYFVELPVPINHQKELRKLYRKFGAEAFDIYRREVMQKHAITEANKQFRERNKWHQVIIRELLERLSSLFARGHKGGRDAVKRDQLQTKVFDSVRSAMNQESEARSKTEESQ